MIDQLLDQSVILLIRDIKDALVDLLRRSTIRFGWITILVSNGADVNGRDSNGDTPLCIAAEKWGIGVCELLVSHGADVNAEGRSGYTPLYCAIERSDDDAVKRVAFLLSKGAVVNKKILDHARFYEQSAIRGASRDMSNAELRDEALKAVAILKILEGKK